MDVSQIQPSCPVRHVVGMQPGQPRYRLLITDDQLNNRRLRVQLLNPLGFTLREAKNGQEAVTAWEEWKPHLIWMDLRMPVMDGYDATKRIKQLDQDRKTVVIALSASTLENDSAKAMAAGCDDFIGKPFREADLFEMLEKYLDVRFIYEEEYNEEILAECQIRTKHPPVLNQKDMAQLPPELLGELKQSALKGDTDSIYSLIDNARPYNAALADALTALADEFEFDKILNIVKDAISGAEKNGQ